MASAWTVVWFPVAASL